MDDSNSAITIFESIFSTIPLCDLLVIIPDLLPGHLLGSWPTRGAGIRVLRLVSKDVGTLAQQCINSYSVDLRSWDSHSPLRVAGLLKDAHLQQLEIAVHVTEGSRGSTASKQSAKCAPYMKRIVTDLGAAIRSVTHLLLDMKVSCHPATTEVVGVGKGASSARKSSNVPLPLPIGVFVPLAAALPSLERLSLAGDYHAKVTLASFGKFGSLCIGLKGLRVQVGLFGEAGLQGMCKAFPQLGHLTFEDNCSRENQRYHMQSFIDYTHMSLSDCSHLTTVEIDCGERDGSSRDQVFGGGRFWESLPPGLTEIICNGSMHHLVMYYGQDIKIVPAVLNGLRSLTSRNPPFDSLGLLLKHAPHLEKLTITGQDRLELMWNSPSSQENSSRLKARVLTGFQISSPRVKFTGSGESVRDLTWLPALHDTTSCSVAFETEERANCLGQIVRVFPNLVHLRLSDVFEWADEHELGEEFLNPLVGCMFLTRLDVCMQLTYTHAGLLALCTSLPSLCSMECAPCDGVEFSKVMDEMRVAGREVVISEADEGDQESEDDDEEDDYKWEDDEGDDD